MTPLFVYVCLMSIIWIEQPAKPIIIMTKERPLYLGNDLGKSDRFDH